MLRGIKVRQVGGAAYRPNRPQTKVQATIRLLSLRFTFVSSEDTFVLVFWNYRSAHAPRRTTVWTTSHHFCASAVQSIGQRSCWGRSSSGQGSRRGRGRRSASVAPTTCEYKHLHSRVQVLILAGTRRALAFRRRASVKLSVICTVQLNNGRALCVMISILALYVSTRTSTEVAASKMSYQFNALG